MDMVVYYPSDDLPLMEFFPDSEFNEVRSEYVSSHIYIIPVGFGNLVYSRNINGVDEVKCLVKFWNENRAEISCSYILSRIGFLCKSLGLGIDISYPDI